MKITLPPQHSDLPRELDTETTEDWATLMEYVALACSERRVSDLRNLQNQCFIELFSKGNYDRLSDAEWDLLTLLNDGIIQLLTPLLKESREPTDRDSSLALPEDLDKLLSEGSVDETRLFQEFYSAKFDDEYSDDSDEDSEDEGRTTQARRKGRRRGIPTHRKNVVDPSGPYVRQLLDRVKEGYGVSYGEKASTPSVNEDSFEEFLSGLQADIEKCDKERSALIALFNEHASTKLAESERAFTQQNATKLYKALTDKTAEGKELKQLTETFFKKTNMSLKEKEKGVDKYFSNVKGMFFWSDQASRNDTIYHPPKVWTEELRKTLAAVNEAIRTGKPVPENPFVIAQYRGIAYNLSTFSAVARRRSRESLELRLPVYASAVFAKVGISPGDYYAGAYAGNDDVQDKLRSVAEELKTALVAKRSSPRLALTAEAARRFREFGTSPGKEGSKKKASEQFNHMLRESETTPPTFENAALALQNFYTINYSGFFHELRQALRSIRDSSEADADQRIFNTLFEGLPLDSEDTTPASQMNPFVSTGNIPRHALRYAYGQKPYTTADLRNTLLPQWKTAGRATTPYAGKVFVTLHPVKDFVSEEGPLDIQALDHQRKLDIPPQIVHERECTFPAYIPADLLVIEHVARYPSFSTGYHSVFLHKYGMEKVEYEAFAKLWQLAFTADLQKKFLGLVAEWLVRYHEARLIELARCIAVEKKQVLVYRGLDGLLLEGQDSEAVKVEGVRSAYGRDLTLQTLDRPRKGRPSEPRSPFPDVLREPQAPVPVVGIGNPGNACYLNSVLQMLAMLDLPTDYERPDEAPFEDGSLRTLVTSFLEELKRDAERGTYLSDEARTFTQAGTLAIRKRLSQLSVVRGTDTQEDACEVLACLLGAHDRKVKEYIPSPDGLAKHLLESNDFADKRPSKLHVALKRIRTCELGEASETVAPPEAVLLDADRRFVTYDATNLHVLALPPVVRVETEGASQSASEPLALPPLLTFDDVLRAARNAPQSSAAESKLRFEGRYYPNGRVVHEQVEFASPRPDHEFFQLGRFTQREDRTYVKDNRPVDMPLAHDGYALRAFIVHDSLDEAQLGPHSGHYIAYVRKGGCWYELNDSRVTATPPNLDTQRQRGYVYYYAKEG